MAISYTFSLNIGGIHMRTFCSITVSRRIFSLFGRRDIAMTPSQSDFTMSLQVRALLLRERDEHLHLDPVHWGYAPGWWDKPALSMPSWKPRRQAECLSHYGNMSGRSVLRMAGLSGSVKVTRNSPISSTGRTARPYSCGYRQCTFRAR